jgi:SH3-like domain-containing protein
MSFQRWTCIALVSLAAGFGAGCQSTGGDAAPAAETPAAEGGEVAMLPMEIVTAKSLNVRAEPNTKGMVLGTLKKGAEVRVLEEKDGWKRVQSDGAAPEGWVHGDYLKGHGQ